MREHELLLVHVHTTSKTLNKTSVSAYTRLTVSDYGVKPIQATYCALAGVVISDDDAMREHELLSPYTHYAQD